MRQLCCEITEKSELQRRRTAEYKEKPLHENIKTELMTKQDFTYFKEVF